MKRIVNTATERFTIWMTDIYGERGDWYRNGVTIDEMEAYGKFHKWMVVEIIGNNGYRVEYDRATKQYLIEEEA